ncbi:innexin unc-9-like isoform X2 [Haliotis cracherodii]|uniref:innexin unc-9-like isoform X2 n=1 Tax=Haliotis cracherodii TaxID=6455 RepID=UPI0039EA6EEB
MSLNLGFLLLPKSLQPFPPYSDDDIMDRLYHRWTVFLLSLLAVVVLFASYVGDPIHCWCPAEFTDSHCNYTETLCWIDNTYFVAENDYAPIDISARERSEIKYYQWVPIILIFMAFCFKLPNVIWKTLNGKGGINLDKMIRVCCDVPFGEEREKRVEIIGNFLSIWLTRSRKTLKGPVHSIIEKVSACCCFCVGSGHGTDLAGLYLSTKLCYLAVSIGMFVLLNKFLAMDYTLYGAELMSHLIQNREIRESPRFPRVTLCDFEIRQLQNIQRYTVQCVLSVNLYNEKIFAFLWFWFILVIILGIYGYCTWFRNIIVPSCRKEYVTKYLQCNDKDHKTNAKEIKFIRDYLATDGVFALRMLEYNTSEMVVMDVVKSLWGKFQGVID